MDDVTNEQLLEQIAELQRRLDASQAAETLLRLKAAGLEAIFDGLPDAVVIADTERRIVKANPAVERLFGLTPEELIGKPTSIFYESGEAFLELGRQRYNLSAEKKLQPYEMNYRRKDGTLFPSETIGTIFSDDKGEPLGFVGIMRDITEQVKTRKVREQAERELEKRVRERTEEIRVLSRTISHDLRNPLVAITGFARLIERRLGKTDDAKLLEYLAKVRESAEWMQSLISDLLELLSARELRLNQVEVELAEIAARAIAMAEGVIEERGIVVRIAPGLPSVFADENLTRRVLENLVQNAVRYMGDQPTPRIEISGQRDGDDEVRVTVADNGRGFSPEDCDRIFQPFERGCATVEGAGLGLAIARRFVELHGGRIWAESDGEGRGARFTFTLPC